MLLGAGLGCGARGMLQLRVQPLGPQLKAFLGAGGNAVALAHGAQAFLVDVKQGDASLRLRREVEEDWGRKVQRILLTHSHRDHVGGLSRFPGVGSVLAHPSTRARMQAEDREAVLRWVPYALVERELRLLLGEDEVRVLYLGPGHTDGDLVAHLPGRGLVVAGDLVLNGFEPYVDEGSGGDVLAYGETLERLLGLPFERLVPGHGAVMTRAEVERWAAYLPALRAEVERAIASRRSEDEAAREVKVTGHPLEALPFLSSREDNVRKMYRALGRKR